MGLIRLLGPHYTHHNLNVGALVSDTEPSTRGEVCLNLGFCFLLCCFTAVKYAHDSPSETFRRFHVSFWVWVGLIEWTGRCSRRRRVIDKRTWCGSGDGLLHR